PPPPGEPGPPARARHLPRGPGVRTGHAVPGRAGLTRRRRRSLRPHEPGVRGRGRQWRLRSAAAAPDRIPPLIFFAGPAPFLTSFEMRGGRRAAMADIHGRFLWYEYLANDLDKAQAF